MTTLTGLAGEQRLDPFDQRIGAGREHAGGELAYGLVALAIVRVAAEHEAGLCDRLQRYGMFAPRSCPRRLSVRF
jgi:hypothetical protein